LLKSEKLAGKTLSGCNNPQTFKQFSSIYQMYNFQNSVPLHALYIYIYIYMSVCKYVYMYFFVYVLKYVGALVCMYYVNMYVLCKYVGIMQVCIYLCAPVYIYTHTYAHVQLYVCKYAWFYVCVQVWMCAYIPVMCVYVWCILFICDKQGSRLYFRQKMLTL